MQTLSRRETDNEMGLDPFVVIVCLAPCFTEVISFHFHRSLKHIYYYAHYTDEESETLNILKIRFLVATLFKTFSSPLVLG